MTERLYYKDCYATTFRATVEAIEYHENKYAVKLNRSTFYPTSGGQLYDTGKIGGGRVIEVVEENGDVVHLFESKPDFAVGDEINGEIDWGRRRDNMQKHTGQHILSQALIRICNAETVSSRLGDEDSTVELNVESITDAQKTQAEDLANQIIFENRPVKIEFVPEDDLGKIPLRKIPDRGKGNYRIVTINDFDWSACGGTHCNQTGSVGIIKITAQEKMRGHVRLHFLTGLKALEDYRWRHEQIEEISNLFTRHGRESFEAVKNLLDEYTALRRSSGELRKKMLPILIEDWYAGAVEKDGHKIIGIDFADGEFKEAKEAVLSIISKHQSVVLAGLNDKIMVGVSESLALSAADILKRLAEKHGGRGGGSPQFAQGGGFPPDRVKVLIADPAMIFDI